MKAADKTISLQSKGQGLNKRQQRTGRGGGVGIKKMLPRCIRLMRTSSSSNKGGAADSIDNCVVSKVEDFMTSRFVPLKRRGSRVYRLVTSF